MERLNSALLAAILIVLLVIAARPVVDPITPPNYTTQLACIEEHLVILRDAIRHQEETLASAVGSLGSEFPDLLSLRPDPVRQVLPGGPCF